MPKKNQNKSNKKDLPRNQKKQLPKLDPNLTQKIPYIRNPKDTEEIDRHEYWRWWIW